MRTLASESAHSRKGRRVVAVGLGNIGSQIVPHLARMPEVTSVVLIDKGRYDDSNVRTQDITPGDVGRRKAQVQRRRMREINPSLDVTAVSAAVEAVPLGRLRADVILGCIDSRAARQYLNQVARHLGMPLVDAGVRAEGLLVRVSTLMPGPENACLECAWDQTDYDAIEQAYPCQDLAGDGEEVIDAPSTGAPAPLGALAAAIQALECRRVLMGVPAPVEGSYEVVVDAGTHRQHLTRIPRNRGCRLADHEPWAVRLLRSAPDEISVGRALALGSRDRDPRAGASLSVDGTPFVTSRRCLSCGAERRLLRLRRSLAGRARVCRVCGGRLVSAGADVISRISAGSIDARLRAVTLRAVGLEAHDIFAVTRGVRSRFYELAAVSGREKRREG